MAVPASQFKDSMDAFDLPLKFSVIYKCEDKYCDEEYILDNCLVPRLTLPCESCGVPSLFYSQTMIHKSWEWDDIELIELDEEKNAQPGI